MIDRDDLQNFIIVAIFVLILVFFIEKAESKKQLIKCKLTEKLVTSDRTGTAYYTLRWLKPNGTTIVKEDMVLHTQNYELGKTYFIKE